MKKYELAPNGTQKVSMEKPLLKLTTPQEKAAAYNGTLYR